MYLVAEALENKKVIVTVNGVAIEGVILPRKSAAADWVEVEVKEVRKPARIYYIPVENIDFLSAEAYS